MSNATVTATESVVTTKGDAPVIPAELAEQAKAWAKAYGDIQRTTGLIEKHSTAREMHRAMGARAIAVIMTHSSFLKGTGNLNKARLATALGLSASEMGRFTKGIELYQNAIASGAIESDSIDDEVHYINAPWTMNAKKMKDLREDNSEFNAKVESASSQGEQSDSAKVPSAPAKDVALSADDLFAKIQELANTVKLLKSANVELSADDIDKAQSALAEISMGL